MRYFGRRLAHAAFLLFGVSLLSFTFLALAPGEFLGEMRANPQMSRETIEALRAQYGLDRSVPVRYARWVGSVVRGEMGYSFAYNMPASTLLRGRIRNTLLLTVIATALAWLIAIPVGVWASVAKGRWSQRFFGGGTSTLLALPDLMVALMLLMFAVHSRRLPAGGMTSPGFAGLTWSGKLADLAAHMALPVLAIVISTLPMLVRHVRSSMMEVLQAPFIQAARYHGLGQGKILFGYCLRAAANPLISLLGLSLAALLSASLLVEIVMGWPGLGPLLLEAVQAHDVHVVIGATLCSTLFLVGGNLVGDILLYAADPRIREGRA